MLNRIKRCRATPSFETDEVTYKVEVAAKVNAARERLRLGADGWEDLLRHAFTHKLNNLTNFRSHDPFLKWMNREPGQCRDALHALWSVDAPPEERLQGFCDQVPTEILGTQTASRQFSSTNPTVTRTSSAGTGPPKLAVLTYRTGRSCVSALAPEQHRIAHMC